MAPPEAVPGILIYSIWVIYQVFTCTFEAVPLKFSFNHFRPAFQ